MANHRRKTIVLALTGLAVIWLLALAGYAYFKHSKVTAESIQTFLNRSSLDDLQGDERSRILKKLASMMSQLPSEERRMARMNQAWQDWFRSMTDLEKIEFIEATMPSGFKQMLESFENLPAEKRQKTIADSMQRLRKARESVEDPDSNIDQGGPGNGPPPDLSPELQEKIIEVGLKTFYSESSAQTKAELAPLLEEMQRQMEQGRPFRRRR
jgi:hypothetical protein